MELVQVSLDIQQLIILLMKDQISNQHLSEILQKPYENRTIGQQKIIANIIQNSIPNCSTEQAKKLAFFVEQFNIQQQLTNGAALFIREDKNENHFQYVTFHHQPAVIQQIQSKFCLIIKNSDINKSKVMCSSIEEEVRYLQNNEYLGEIPKKRFYSLMKNAQAIILSYGEFVFSNTNPKALDRNVYFVRKGQFCYEVKDETQQKHIEILTFKEGHFFNQANEFTFHHQDSMYMGFEQQIRRRKILNIRCKSSKGVIYKLSKEYFISHLLKYCEQKLKQNTQKLNDLLQQRVDYVKKHRKVNNKLLAQKSYRSASVQIQSLIASKVSTSRKSFVPKEPTPILDIGQKTQDYKILKSEQPPRNRIYSKSQLMKFSINPEQNQSDLLLWKKSKCLRLKEITKGTNTPLPKSQTMLKFIKQTIVFQKNRKKPIIF